MLKARIVSKKSVNSVMNERKILAKLAHPFIVNMKCSFQCRENLYLVMDLLPGGDLRYHLIKNRKFSELQSKFFIACLLTALEYLHEYNIIHRDIKPENLVFDSKGYLRLTDFGIARIWQLENSQETSGTPGYMAPEVICRQNHNIAADYFAVGVLAYEFMLGKRPYIGRSRKEIRDSIIARQVQVKNFEIPEGWSLEAVDFINKLLQRKQQVRLGFKGVEEVKAHSWFQDFSWQELFQKTLKSPFVPLSSDNFDARQIANEWNDEADIVDMNESMQNLFIGYDFDSTIMNSIRTN